MKTITEYKNALKGLPKEEKINALQQEIANLTLFPGPPPGGTPKEEKNLKLKVQLKKLLEEIKLNPEAYESSTKNKELLPFMYDRDLDWFYNLENIPNQDLVFATLEYFETGERIGIFEPLDFMNLFWKQFNFVKANIKKPHSTITTLKTLPLNPEQEHILFGFILKWFGGYPIENMNEQYNTTLRLIEREFLAFEGETPEKEFCQRNWKGYKRMKQIESFVNKNLNNVNTGLEYLENKEKDEIPLNQKPEITETDQNNFLLSTIEDYLEPYKDNFTDESYKLLINELYSYFTTGNFTNSSEAISVIGKPNVKKIGWQLNEIYRNCKNDNSKLPLQYLKFGKERISIFKDVGFEETNYLKSNLYKYYTTKPPIK